MKIKKRVFSLIIAIFISILSVITSYTEVMAFDIPTAFWGTLEASRAFWTALNTGGALENGISISKFERSSREDVQKLMVNILVAYKAFCIQKEKIQVALEHDNWTDEQILSEATTRAQQDVNNFKTNAIDVTNTTKNITLKDWGYWREFCQHIKSVAKNGLGGSIGNGSVRGKVNNNSGYTFTNAINSGENTFDYDEHYFIYKGTYALAKNGNWVVENYETGDVPTDRIRIPYICTVDVTNTLFFYELDYVDINRLTGNIIGGFRNIVKQQMVNYANSDYQTALETLLSMSNFPCIINHSNSTDFISECCNNYKNTLDVENVTSSAPLYEQEISDALNDTEVGQAIIEGGTQKKEVVTEGTIPLKRSSLKTNEETATGVIGWDIPDTTTLEGAIAQPETEDEEIKATGIISVPESAITNAQADTTTVSFPAETAVDSAVPITDNPAIPITVADVISIQGGEYYPNQIDLTQFFPFCIPFDLAYCIQKFAVGHGQAPRTPLNF